MPGIGTIVNVFAVLGGGTVGLLFSRFIKKSMQKTIMQSLGLATSFIGIAGALQHIFVIKNNALTVTQTLTAAICLALGAFIGEIFDLDGQIMQFGTWLRKIAKREGDTRFVDGFIIATLTTCIGAMAIVGALQDGINHDPSMLFTKAILDGTIIMLYAAAFGIGPLFACIPIGILQGGITLFSFAIKPFLTTTMTNGLSLVGSMLILCIGLNLLLDAKIKVANMLPSLLVIIIYSAFF